MTGCLPAPDYAKLHQELGRKGMTLMLLWQEHAELHPDKAIHSSSQFCENYHRFAKTLNRSMRQVHRAGEKPFIDYAGPTFSFLPWVSQATPLPMPRHTKPVPIFTMAAVFDAAQTQSTATQSIATIVNHLSCDLDTNQEAKGASTL